MIYLQKLKTYLNLKLILKLMYEEYIYFYNTINLSITQSVNLIIIKAKYTKLL